LPGSILVFMTDVTLILSQIEQGDPSAAEELLPLVYDELRKLAAAKLAHEKPGQTLQATALVHDAYIRLVDVDQAQQWDSRAHFFAAAAEAMRRILIENVRRKKSRRHGGEHERLHLLDEDAVVTPEGDKLLMLDEALTKLAKVRPHAAELVQLRVFAGLSTPEAARTLNVPERTARRTWTYARAWLRREMQEGETADE
jgi:RNA polymerase sigma factor (TIGR02999 family)